jgi:hypothetical protein
MKFREDLDEVLARTKTFHASSRKGTALIEISSVGDINARFPQPDLRDWSFPSDMKDYLTALYAREKNIWRQRAVLKDDRIPSVTAWYGIAEHSAYVGGSASFSKDTSYHHPFIKTWDDLEKLSLDEDNPWRRMLDDGLAFLKNVSEGECAVSLRGTYSPLEIANAARGNELFTDFYEYPREVKTLLDFCARAVAWNISRQKKIVGLYEGGILSGFKSWIPGDSFGQISEDTTVLTGPTLYEEFGKAYTHQALRGLDKLFVHTHSLGEASIRNILSIGNVYMLEISSDPNSSRGIEAYKRLNPDPDRIVGVLSLTYQEIIDNLDFLKDRKTIIWHDADNLESAQGAIDLVRRELPIPPS